MSSEKDGELCPLSSPWLCRLLTLWTPFLAAHLSCACDLPIACLAIHHDTSGVEECFATFAEEIGVESVKLWFCR